MSEAVKRYWLESFIDDFYKARQFVLAADHDRIVSSLTEAGVKMQAERDTLCAENERLRTERFAMASALMRIVDLSNSGHGPRHSWWLMLDIAAEARRVLGLEVANG